MHKPLVFMFSGQGTQYFQMGRELFDCNPVFHEWMLKLDISAKKLSNVSIIDYIYNEKKKKSDWFDHNEYSGLAILMIEYSLSKVLIEKGIEPDYLLGSSLGEFTAAMLAEVVGVEEIMAIFIETVQALENCCQQSGMIGILDKPELFHKAKQLRKNCDLAGINFDSHFVVSGRSENLRRIELYLKGNNIIYQKLMVAYGYHSSVMDQAKPKCDHIIDFELNKKPTIPIISSVYAKHIKMFPKDYFWQVLRKPMLFQQTIRELEEKGSYIYVDLGPSGTLANYVKKNLKQNDSSKVFQILNLFGQDLKNITTFENFYKTNYDKNKEKNTMLTYVFPGQGSQKKGMGKDLFDEFKDLTEKADSILGYSIKELCVEDPQKQLGQTQYTQPALYVVNALSYLKKVNDSGIKPDFVTGHSLGEYNALFAAGAFDFVAGLELVKKRGAIMSRVTGGGMAAVIGANEKTILEILEKNNLNQIEIANFNTPSQIVIAGPKKDIDNAKSVFAQAGVKLYIPLSVSGAFHSSYMQSARDEFESFLESYKFSTPSIPIMSNVTALPYKNQGIKDNLVQQITSSVMWTNSIRYLMGKGKMEFEEIGPGMVLTGLIKKIQEEADPIESVDETSDPVESIDNENAQEAITEIRSKETVLEASVKLNNTGTTTEYESQITSASLGNKEFKKEYNLKFAYATGAMYKGIASKELVVAIGKAGMIGFFGSGGVALDKVEDAIQYIQAELCQGQAYGINLLNSPLEESTVDLYLKYKVKNIEAAAYMQITPALVRYRLKGLIQNENGNTTIQNKILAKVSRPEVAKAFLTPAPERIVKKLLEEDKITPEQAELAKSISMADDLIVEADSGGHTDQGVAYALMPAMMKLRDEMMAIHKYKKQIRVGAAGGIGTPESAAAAFIMGADFILTGSINQCTVEAATSDHVKDLLQQINVQDTGYAPAGDMFEFGAKVQVLRKGVFFPARANKLFEIYQRCNSLDEIDEKTKKQIQENYFKRSFEEIFNDCKEFYSPKEIEKAQKNSKHKMALIFKWYFGYSTSVALNGDKDRQVDFQVQTGPALGAFNQWIKGTELEKWKNRNVDRIAEKLMKETAELLNQRINQLVKAS